MRAATMERPNARTSAVGPAVGANEAAASRQLDGLDPRLVSPALRAEVLALAHETDRKAAVHAGLQQAKARAATALVDIDRPVDEVRRLGDEVASWERLVASLPEPRLQVSGEVWAAAAQIASGLLGQAQADVGTLAKPSYVREKADHNGIHPSLRVMHGISPPTATESDLDVAEHYERTSEAVAGFRSSVKGVTDELARGGALQGRGAAQILNCLAATTSLLIQANASGGLVETVRWCDEQTTKADSKRERLGLTWSAPQFRIR